MTHPFHPLFGREFELVTYRHNWGEDRAYFEEPPGQVRGVPAGWTSLVAPDPVVVLGAGRSCFRIADLLELAQLLRNASR